MKGYMLELQMMKCSRLVMILLLIGFGQAENDENEYMIIDTPSGPVKGVKEKNKMTGETVYEFRGIPFGKPPLRFHKPEPAEKWKDIRDATEFGPSCPHFLPDMMAFLMPEKMSEDCLFLNVYVPKEMNINRRLSVMVWIHGGGFLYGFSNQYDGGWIATEGDVIVVTMNYRLTIFGFLALDHLAAKGNYGLWDQKLALEWVHNNIVAFGGNPESVTIFGESAGGWSVSFQSLIPSNKDLFQRVIAQSGVVGRTSMQSKNMIKYQNEELSKRTSCPVDDKNKFVSCLMEKSMEELINASDYMIGVPNDRIEFIINYNPVMDGDLFPVHPIESLANEQSDVTKFFRSLDFLAGTTSNEGSMLLMSPEYQEHFQLNFTEGISSEVLCQGVISHYVETYFNDDADIKQRLCEFYTTDTSLADQSMRALDFYADVMFLFPTIKMLERHAPSDTNTFQYFLSKATEEHMFPQPPWQKGVAHGEDLAYIFDTTPFGMMRNLSEDEKEVSRRMIKYLTSFAKTGIPDCGEGSVQWKQYDLEDRRYLDIDVTDTIRNNLKQDMNEFWTEQLPPIELDPIEVEVHDEL